jgi:hypothetical protein
MKVTFYPNFEDISDPHGVEKLLKDLKSRYPRLWALVKEAIKDISRKEVTNLDDYVKTKWVSRLSHVSEPLYEFRIPPRAKGGVVRLYFAYMKDKGSIKIFSGEIKIGNGTADAAKIQSAIQRYREEFEK